MKPAVWDLVLEDMATRDKLGRHRYGIPLRPNNGRDALQDAYEESLDLVVYLRQVLHERDSQRGEIEKLKAIITMVEYERDAALSGEARKREFRRGAAAMRAVARKAVRQASARLSPRIVSGLQDAIKKAKVPERKP